MSHLWHFGVNKLYQIFNVLTGNRVRYRGRTSKRDLTAVAGGSFVSCVRTVAVECTPRLGALPSMFTITGRAPVRQNEANSEKKKKEANQCPSIGVDCCQKIYIKNLRFAVFYCCYDSC